MGKLTYLIIHCTATPEGREVTSDTIRHWHMDPPPAGRGWGQVGYSVMCHLTGELEVLVKTNDDDTVDAWEITNGVAGMNSISRHIVYVGGTDAAGKPKDTRTDEQKAKLEFFVKQFLVIHPHVKVAGHTQFDHGKACPSFDVPSWLREIGVAEENIYQ